MAQQCAVLVDLTGLVTHGHLTSCSPACSCELWGLYWGLYPALDVLLLRQAVTRSWNSACLTTQIVAVLKV